VEAGALAQLFAIFMGRSKIKNSRGDASDRDVAKEVEERCVSIISNLFQVCGNLNFSQNHEKHSPCYGYQHH
jgi:hypothetical protein